MGITSENVARRYGVDRKMQDEYALLSHTRANEALAAGRFEAEIVPIEYTVYDNETGKTSQVRVAADDTIRPNVTLEKLAKLKPAFLEDGGSTAGNS
jgi:acetyl-CoA acyltransferase 1